MPSSSLISSLTLTSALALLAAAAPAPAITSSSVTVSSAAPTSTTVPPASIPAQLTYSFWPEVDTCSGVNQTVTITPNKCTFIEQNDDTGAMSYNSFIPASNATAGTQCYVNSWTQPSTSNILYSDPCSVWSPNMTQTVDSLVGGGCGPILDGLYIMLVCD